MFQIVCFPCENKAPRTNLFNSHNVNSPLSATRFQRCHSCPRKYPKPAGPSICSKKNKPSTSCPKPPAKCVSQRYHPFCQSTSSSSEVHSCFSGNEAHSCFSGNIILFPKAGTNDTSYPRTGTNDTCCPKSGANDNCCPKGSTDSCCPKTFTNDPCCSKTLTNDPWCPKTFTNDSCCPRPDANDLCCPRTGANDAHCPKPGANNPYCSRPWTKPCSKLGNNPCCSKPGNSAPYRDKTCANESFDQERRNSCPY